jgi:DNA mismatch repair protein MutL
MAIKKLSKEVAQGIAAGEVVERPSSVVKELIENSIDAGAETIEILLEGAGKTLISVSDDGSGIPEADIPLVTSRYSTSKIRTLDDLDHISTLGFRGEALASIAGVSRFSLISRHVRDEIGSKLIVEGGDIKQQIKVGTKPGTVVEVRDLFFNVPARMKFLKSDNTEKRRISKLVSRFAIAYPRIQLKYSQDGRSSIHSKGSGDLREAFSVIHGVDWARQMIAVDGTGANQIRVHGLISPPGLNRSNRNEIVLFINGRWIQDVSLSTAVMQAYHALLMVGRYPVAYLFIDVPPDQLDVNVHPGKTEVRFSDPNLVFGIVQRVLRTNLLGQSAAVEASYPSSWRVDFGAGQELSNPGSWRELSRLRSSSLEKDHSGPTPAFRTDQMPLLRAVGQVGATYLVAEGPDGVYLIDQHAAHERVLFEKMSRAQVTGEPESQAILQPETIELNETEASLLVEHLKILQGLGFDLELFGERTFKVRSLPVIVQNLSAEAALRAVVEDIEEDETPFASRIEDRIIARVCKRAAVKAGQVLSLQEQEQLLYDLEQCEAPRTCPHGRPTMVHFPVTMLERQFGRRT